MLTKELIEKMVVEDRNRLIEILDKNIKQSNANLLLVEKGEMDAEFMEEDLLIIKESNEMIELIKSVA